MNNVRDLIGRTFTLSFWVRSSKVGVHCASFSNSPSDRSYVVEYTINSANTWEFKTITVSGGLITAGTWHWATEVGLTVRFCLAAGATFQTAPNAWQTGNFAATSNQVNCLDTVGNIFAITGVQLEVGSVATPFEHRPYGLELALCQRYYFRVRATGTGPTVFAYGYNYSTTAANVTIPFPVPMRVAPSALEQSGTAADYVIAHGAAPTACSSVPTLFGGTSNVMGSLIFTVASGLTVGQGVLGTSANSNANAYLGFSAEL